MKKLRWAMDGGSWELDVSTAATVEGEGRAVGGVGEAIPLGVTRGKRLSRPRQIDFFQRFMATPFLPSFSPSSQGWALHRLLPLPLTNSWFASLLAQFKVGQFVSSLQRKHDNNKSFFAHLWDKSLYAVGMCSELMLSPSDVLYLSYDAYGDRTPPRKKAIFHHQFSNHDFTVEAVSPALFVDKSGSYWDVPFSVAADLASLSSESGLSYHLCMRHNSGDPLPFQTQQAPSLPLALLPGTTVKAAASFKQILEFWRSKAPKLKMVQPFDMFLSNPHVSASAIIGAALTACHGENLVNSIGTGISQDSKGFCLHAPSLKSTILADVFSSVSFTAQHGNFQRLFLDLTRCHIRLDVPSCCKFFSGATQLAQDFFNSQQPTVEAVQAICPAATISFQQQIVGPFSFRVDSEIGIDLKNKDRKIYVHEPVFAIEYALQVLGSAKAIAWYSPKQQEFMADLWGLFSGLQIGRDLGVRKLQVEMDSRVVIKLLLSTLPGVHPLASIPSNYGDLLAREWTMAWKHVDREEANRAADRIANFGCNFSVGLSVLKDPRDGVHQILFEDSRVVTLSKSVSCNPNASSNQMDHL